MKYPTKPSDAVHILAFLALFSAESMSSNDVADSIHTNPDCGVGVNIQRALRDCYDLVQKIRRGHAQHYPAGIVGTL